jgi:hypothetical protein
MSIPSSHDEPGPSGRRVFKEAGESDLSRLYDLHWKGGPWGTGILVSITHFGGRETGVEDQRVLSLEALLFLFVESIVLCLMMGIHSEK